MASGLLLIVLAYLAGSIPFGLLVGRLVRGIDIRQHGSGNIGATNVGRVLGSRWGFCVLGLDLLKGLLPVWLLSPLCVAPDSADFLNWQVGAGIATIAGHMFPCWLGFRGGKGVATALGVVLWLAPWASAIAAALFAATFAASRIVSLSSLVAATGFATAEMIFLRPHPFSIENWSLGGFSLLVPALIVARHRQNILRLIRGTEPKYSTKPGPAEQQAETSSD